MKNFWPDQFEENAKPAAKSILEEQAKLLPKITGGIVFAEVSEMDQIEALSTSMRNDFSYRFDIRGKFLEHYRFNVLTFSHDITLYPIKFLLDERIALELDIKKSVYGYVHKVDAPENLEDFLAAVLVTERVKNVVGSIIRLSK